MSPNRSFHHGGDCGWPDTLMGRCPDCHKDGLACTSFSENAEEPNRCPNTTRTSMLAARSQLDNPGRKLVAQVRARLNLLSGGESPPGILDQFARLYTDQLTRDRSGTWYPTVLDGIDQELYLDQTDPKAWCINLETTTLGATPVTLGSLYTAWGIQLEPRSNVQRVQALQTKVADLERQLAEAKRQQFSQQQLPQTPVTQEEVSRAATAAAAAFQSVRTNFDARSPRNLPNPSQVLNLGDINNRNGNVVVQPHLGTNPSDVDFITSLVAAGVDTATVVALYQARAQQNLGNVPPPTPVRHVEEWRASFEGTNPLSQYTALRSETRQGTIPKSLRVEILDTKTGQKYVARTTAYPPSDAALVEGYDVAPLGEAWTRALIEANGRNEQITPPADRGILPHIPTDTEAFLVLLSSSLRLYPTQVIMRAWEGAHHYVLDEYLSGRSNPSWNTMWMMPVFQVVLNQAVPNVRKAPSTSSASQFCINWNFATGHKCKSEKNPDCKKLHKCVRCSGDHPFVKCSSSD